MEPVTCHGCRWRNKCMEYSRMLACLSYRKMDPRRGEPSRVQVTK